MNEAAITELAEASLCGTMSFPELVVGSINAGVEFYHVVYTTLREKFYGPDNRVAEVPLRLNGLPPFTTDFDAAAIAADILDSQQNGQAFIDFSRRAAEAGVIGYYAFLRGQRVTYFARTGDQHTEWFHGARLN